jgi:hypothetical protein
MVRDLPTCRTHFSERVPPQLEAVANEQDAKAFAKDRLAEGSEITAGTLNPHSPKRFIGSAQILDWLNE